MSTAWVEMVWLESCLKIQSEEHLPGLLSVKHNLIDVIQSLIVRGTVLIPGHKDKFSEQPTWGVTRAPHPQARASATTFPKFSCLLGKSSQSAAL